MQQGISMKRRLCMTMHACLLVSCEHGHGIGKGMKKARSELVARDLMFLDEVGVSVFCFSFTNSWQLGLSAISSFLSLVGKGVIELRISYIRCLS